MDAQNRVSINDIQPPAPVHWSWKQQHHMLFGAIGEVIEKLSGQSLNDITAVVCNSGPEQLYCCESKKEFLDVITMVCNEDFMMDELQEAEDVYNTAHRDNIGDDHNIVFYVNRILEGYVLFILPARFCKV